jgi:hypothetical protein
MKVIAGLSLSAPLARKAPARSLGRWNELALATLAEGGWKTARRDVRGSGGTGGDHWRGTVPRAGSTKLPGESSKAYVKAIDELGDKILVALRDTGPIQLPELAETMGLELSTVDKRRLAGAVDVLIGQGAITYRPRGNGIDLWSDMYDLRDGRAVMVPRSTKSQSWGGEGGSRGQRKRALAVAQRVGSRHHDAKTIHRMFLEDAIVRYHANPNESVDKDLVTELLDLVGQEKLRNDWMRWRPDTREQRAARDWLLDQIDEAPLPGQVFVRVTSHRQWKNVVRELGRDPQTYYNLSKGPKSLSYNFYVTAAELARLKAMGVKVTRVRGGGRGWSPQINFGGGRPEPKAEPESVPVPKPVWETLMRNAQGKKTERVWKLGQLDGPRWAGTAVFDYNYASSGRKRYQIWHEKPRGSGTYVDSGIGFSSQRDLIRWMGANPPREVTT